MRIHQIIFILFLPLFTSAQSIFLDRGKIHFERRIGQMTLMESISKEEESVWMESYRKSFPKVVSDKYELIFDARKSMYKLGVETEGNKYIFQGMKPVESDVVQQSFGTGESVMARSVFERNYLVKDSLPVYEWKISAETRNIAGFECRKALTRISDSVVVVAFYTDEITVPGGPEQFNGLPGMILGIAIPRLSLTLFATSVERGDRVVLTEPVLPKGRPVLRDQLSKELKKGIDGWGDYGQVVYWLSQL
jgi:GLPGLI family protein